MSTLGDLIVEHGPYSHDLLVGAGFSSDLRWVRAVDLTALRDELIELSRWRRAFARAGKYRDACAAEGENNEANAITEALRRMSTVVDGTEVNA